MSRFKFSAIEVNIYTLGYLIAQQSVSTSTSTSTSTLFIKNSIAIDWPAK